MSTTPISGPASVSWPARSDGETRRIYWLRMRLTISNRAKAIVSPCTGAPRNAPGESLLPRKLVPEIDGRGEKYSRRLPHRHLGRRPRPLGSMPRQPVRSRGSSGRHNVASRPRGLCRSHGTWHTEARPQSSVSFNRNAIVEVPNTCRSNCTKCTGDRAGRKLHLGRIGGPSWRAWCPSSIVGKRHRKRCE